MPILPANPFVAHILSHSLGYFIKMSQLDNPLRKSILTGDIEKFKTLLQGKDINRSLADGWTVLHHVCHEGQDLFLDYLFSRGASPNKDFEFFTPLMAVCSSRSCDEDKLVKCAKTLIERKADVEAMDKTKVTALMYACQNGHEKLVHLLLESQCNVNNIDNDGYSALHLACMNDFSNIVKMLLDFGADKHMKDRRGRSPLDLAISRGAEDIILMLDDSKPEITPATEVMYKIQKTDFEELLDTLPSYAKSSGKGGFQDDVAILLSGMRLEKSADLFSKKNIGLFQFLNITNDELKSLGLYFSSHRNRVITGNKRFISQGWGDHSLPKENKNGSIMDVTRVLANGVKHIHILLSTCVYCKNRFVPPTNEDEEQKLVNLFDITLRAHRQVKTLINELKLIHDRVDNLDKVHKVKPVDLVLPIKCKGHFSRNLFLVTALCAVVVWKFNLVKMLRK